MGHFFSIIKFRIALLLFITFPFILVSQTKEIDSLQNVLSTQGKDTARISVLLQLAEANILDNQDRSLFYYKQASRLSDSLNYSYGMANCQYKIALYYMRFKGLPDSSLPYTNRAIAIADSMDYLRILLKAYRLKTIFSSLNDDMIEMKFFTNKCLAVSIRLNDSVDIGKAYNSFGIIAFNEAKYDSAVIWYMKALEIYKKTNIEKSIGITYINLALVFIKMEDNDLAEKYLLSALTIKDKLWRHTYMLIVYDNLGLIYTDKGNYKEAIKFFDLGIELALLSNQGSEYSHLLINKSVVLINQGNFAQGIEDIKEALWVSRENDYGDVVHYALFSLASVYATQGKYQEAINYYDSALILLKDRKFSEGFLSVCKYLFPIYEKIGNYKKALHYQSLYFNLKDSLFSVEKMETINSLEIKYQKKKNEARILHLENDNLKKDNAIHEKESQRNIITYTALAILLFITFLFVYYRQRTRKNRIITEQQIKQLEEEKKLLAARSLVEGQEEERKRIAKDLHDGIGVLLSTAKIQVTALKDKNPENSKLVSKAGKLLEQAAVDVRRISHNMMPSLLTEFGFDESIEELFEQLDGLPDLSANVNINENESRIIENQEIMLYRIIQELANNTLKHAKAKNISLNLIYDDDMLNIQYADDGVGFDMKKDLGQVSIGMKGIESRVSYLNGSIDLESELGNGFLCHIQVPIAFRK